MTKGKTVSHTMLSSVIRVAPRIPLVIIRALHSLPPPGKLSRGSPFAGRRILERDIKLFTVEGGKLADRVRTNPKLQLHCVGGSAQDSKYHPSQMQFVNAGVDAQGKVNWIGRTSSLSSKVQMGTVEVSFEGWSGPGDEYVRSGSEIVRYELNWTGGAEKDNSLLIILLVVAGIILSPFIFSEIHQQSVQGSPQIIYQQPHPQVVYQRPAPKVVHVETPQYKAPKVIHVETPQYKTPKVVHVETPQIVFAKSKSSE